MWTFGKCCCCVDLRLGSLLIAYFMLIARVGALVTSSIHLARETDMLHQGVHTIVTTDLSFHRMTTIITLMILIFEILLTIALIVGLVKRLDQHLEMYYVGSFAFLVLGICVYAVVLMRYAERLGRWAWLVVAVEICMKMISIYFLAVIRSYYYRMKAENKANEEKMEAGQNTSIYARTKPGLVNSKP